MNNKTGFPAITNHQDKVTRTRECIIEAARLFLQKNSRKKFTTNKVAALAGVSIGTVYNHFKNKDEIFTALIEDELRSNYGAIYEYISRLNENFDIIEFFNTGIDLAIEHYRNNIELRKMIYEYMKFTEINKLYTQANKNINEALIEIITRNLKSTNTTPIYILITSIRSVLKFYCEFYPEKFQTDEIAKELKALITNYLENSLLKH
ncbi:TetR/AcrR family transcriptional regulator [Halobacteriovorax sp. DPLXC-1]|uniref:TetR/AcrR family transcriptional regulator n=1 Tax=Halobacteriovorax sp. DPLXC-1 TaxID=3110771 RepID=UPI002FEF7BC0